ncbi:MAG: UPF0280 family protein [Desulfobulbaceae bacterium]|nr:UPF0280 family protein [Desulfobulbaceae bacterium]
MKRKHPKKKTPLAYEERAYRTLQQSGLVSTYVRMAETDLHILAPVKVEDEALVLVAELRLQLENYIRSNRFFADSLIPLAPDPSASPIVREMLTAGRLAEVGPMAAVAGALAESIGHRLLALGLEEVIVENGGDIFLARSRECTVAVFAGESPLSNRIGIRLAPEQMPCGICCSSASIGHSLSFGRADAVVVTAASTALADAAATRLGNEVKSGPGSIEKALKIAREIRGISGVLIVRNEQLGAWGAIELERL